MHHTGYSDPSTNLLDSLNARLAALDAGEALRSIVPFRPGLALLEAMERENVF